MLNVKKLFIININIDVEVADTLKKLKLFQNVCKLCVIKKQHRVIN